MSAEAWAGFRRAVLADPALQRDLLAAPDPEPFCALVVERARGLGWDVEPDDVEAALRTARRAWIERWI
ncbi:MAG TPA: Nif11-like leader peptide family natural product precursor [Acidimicrobiales bacterium]